MESDRLRHRTIKRALIALLLFLGSFGLTYSGLHVFSLGLADHFTLSQIKGELPTSSHTLSVNRMIFQQDYFYLGKGSQSYVFESDDHQWVIKFFRLNRYRTPLLNGLPPFLEEIQKNKAMAKQEKQEELFLSCRIAYKKLRQESGLVYLHLEKTNHLKQKLLIHDRLARPYVINLDEYAFLVQKKAEPLYSYLTRLMKQGDQEGVQEALGRMSNLLLKRFHKGVADHDPVIEKNAGFIDGEAIFMDTGQFYLSESLKEPQVYKKEGERVVRKLRRWLSQKDPCHAEIYLESLNF